MQRIWNMKPLRYGEPQNGIEYIVLKSEKDNKVEYLVKSSDDYLILLYAKAKADKDLMENKCTRDNRHVECRRQKT